MSNAVVPFQQMQTMANAVAKSGLFGVKAPEQALALMMLAQAENIHPMTAVRDYHIINGRPSMKAEAMLARFQEAGGKVQWHALGDMKADATFSHPSAPEPIRIDWTMERATKAGLAGKDIWKAYPRAMLRSRVISEGIRTVLPGVLAGKYTPEEAMHIETMEPINVEAAIQSFGTSLPDEEAASFLRDISEAPTLEALRDNFAAAWKRAKDRGDEQRQTTLKTAYDARKAELETPPLSLVPDETPATDKGGTL